MYHSLTNRISKLRAFTFLEIAVAVVVAGIVIGGSVPIVINAKQKSDRDRMAASVKTLTDANWRLEITGEGTAVTKGGNNKFEALDYYLQRNVLADANAVNLEGLIFSNGVWGTMNDSVAHFSKSTPVDGQDDSTGNRNPEPMPEPDPNQAVLDLLTQTQINGKSAPELLSDPEGEPVEWVFTDRVTGETRTNKVGRWDPTTGKSTSGSGGEGDYISGGGGGGYGSGSVPQTISKTNYNEDGSIESITQETVWGGGPTAEAAGCLNATLSLSISPGTRAGTVTGGGSYKIGDLGYIFAAPELGWRFKRWVRSGNSQYAMTSEFPLMQVPIDSCVVSFVAEFESLSGFLSFEKQGTGLLSVWTDRGSFPTVMLSSFSSISEIGQKWRIEPTAGDGHIFRYWQSPQLYKPEFDYTINTEGILNVTGSRPNGTSLFTAYFSKLGDHGEDTSGCLTKTVTGSVHSSLSGLEGGAELGEVIPVGELYKSVKGYFGSIIAAPASGHTFSHWVVEFTDLSSGNKRVVASTSRSFSLDNINSCSIKAQAFFSPKIATPTPTPVVSNPASLSYQSDPSGTARFFVTGATGGLTQGTVNFPNPGGVRVSVVPAEGHALKSATASSATGPLTLTEISHNSFYLSLLGGANTFQAETEVDPDAPVYAGTLTVRARSETGQDTASVEILGVDQDLFTSGTNWEKGPTSTIPVYAGQTISVKLAQSSRTSLLQILQSHNFVRVQSTGPDTYDIHILPEQKPGGNLDMYVTFITSRAALPAVPEDEVLAEDSCTWPISVSATGSEYDIQDSPDYTVDRGSGYRGTAAVVDFPVPGKEYTFTIVDTTGNNAIPKWHVSGGGANAHRYSINGNVLKVIAGKRDCADTQAGGVFFVPRPDGTKGLCPSTLYRVANIYSDYTPEVGGVYHRSSEVSLFLNDSQVVRNSFVRADGKYRVQPIIGAGNTYQWVIQKYTDGGAWLLERTFNGGPEIRDGAAFPICPPAEGGNSLFDDGTYDPNIVQPGGTSAGQGLVSLVTRNGSHMQWKVVTEKTLENGEKVKVSSKSGTLKPSSDITLAIGGDQILEVSTMVSGGVTFLGGKRPFQVLYEKYARYLEFSNYAVALAPKENSHIVLTAPTSGDPAFPTPGGSQTPTQVSGPIFISNASSQLGKLLTSKDILVIHGDTAGNWGILPGSTRALPASSLTGGMSTGWPVILALTTDRFQWEDLPGAQYSSDRRVISFAKPMSSIYESVTVRAVDRSVIPSPTPSGEWGTVRVTSKVSRQPWYFEISGGSGVVGLVGADNPLLFTEPPAGFSPVPYFGGRVGGQLTIARDYNGIVFDVSQNKSTAMFPWPKAGEHIELVLEDLDPDSSFGSPPPMGSPGGTPSQSTAPVVIVNASFQLGKILTSNEVMVVHGDKGQNWAILPGFTRSLPASSLTGGASTSWPVILALTTDRFQWGDVPGAQYSNDRKVISFAKPISESLTVWAVDRSVIPSPTPSGEWGTVRVTSKVSKQPWYFEISGGAGVVGLVGAGSPLLFTEPPAGFNPVHYFANRVGGQLTVTRNYDGVVFESSQNKSTAMFPWPKAGEHLELVIEDLNPGDTFSSPPPMGSPTDTTSGQVSLIISPNVEAGYFHNQDSLAPYFRSSIGTQQTLTARANNGWRLVGLRYSLPGSSMAYTTGLGDSLVFEMPSVGSVTAHFERFVGGSPSPGQVFEPETPVEEAVDIVSLWFNMSDEEKIAYGVQKAISQGLPPFLLSPAERAYVDALTIWKFFGWRGLTEQQRSTIPISQIWGRADIAGYTIKSSDIKAGYNIGDNVLSFWRYFGWNALTEAQRQTLPISQIWGQWDGDGYRITANDIKAGYNLGDNANWSMGRLNFAGRDLQGLTMIQGRGLGNSNFAGANLSGSSFAGSYSLFGDSNFTGADFSGVNFDGTSILFSYPAPLNINLAGSSYNKADRPFHNGLRDSNLAGANFAGSDRPFHSMGSDTRVTNVNLAGANFMGAGWAFNGNSFSGGNLAGVKGLDNFRAVSYDGVASGGIPTPDMKLSGDWSLMAGYILGPGVNLTGANLSGLNLQGMNFTGVRSAGGIIVDANTKLPTGWTLLNGMLWGQGANLTGADLSGLNLEDVNLSGITFGGIKVDGETKLPEGWLYFGGYIIPDGGTSDGPIDISGMNVEGADLSQFDIRGWRAVNLSGMPGALPEGYGLFNGTLVGPGMNLTGATLSGANLSSYNLHGSIVAGVAGLDSAVLPSGWKSYGSFAVGPGAAFDDVGPEWVAVNFAGQDITDLQLGRLEYGFSNGNFAGANLSGLRGQQSRWAFNAANLAGAEIDGANFAGSYELIRNANLAGAKLSNIDLSGSVAAFQGANLAGVNIDGVNLQGSFGAFRRANLAGLNSSGRDIFGDETFIYSNLAGSNFAGSDFTTVMRHALYGSNLVGANLVGVNAVGVYLPMHSANLTGANLAGVNIFQTDFALRHANLVGANLSGINLTDARWALEYSNFAGVSSGNIVGTNRNLYNGWWLNNGYIFGPQVNLAGADLLGINLMGVNLEGANLQGALGSGILVDGSTKLPSGWSVVDGVLVGP